MIFNYQPLIDQGIIPVRQNDHEMNTWRQSAEPSIEKLLKDGAVSRDLYEEMQSYIDEFRKREGTGQKKITK